jgi:hypothetical protein
LSTWTCPEAIHEAFVIGTEPAVTCDGRRVEAESQPAEKVFNWFERLFHGR